MDRFAVEILPVVVQFASVCFKCPDKQSLALTMAWFNWSRATPDKQQLPASVWARVGVRWVNARRDLPGLGTPAKDALHRADSSGSMDGLPDTYPGPERIAMERERYANVVNNATDRERILIESFEAGEQVKDVAAKLGISSGRVTQLRQGLMK